jgi:hypothetical protein
MPIITPVAPSPAALSNPPLALSSGPMTAPMTESKISSKITSRMLSQSENASVPISLPPNAPHHAPGANIDLKPLLRQKPT